MGCLFSTEDYLYSNENYHFSNYHTYDISNLSTNSYIKVYEPNLNRFNNTNEFKMKKNINFYR